MKSATWRAPENHQSTVFDENRIRELLNPIFITIEADDPISVSNLFKASIRSDQNLKGAHYMLYGMAKCFSGFAEYSKISGVVYDAVVRYRFDIQSLDYEIIRDACRVVAKNSNLIFMAPHNWAMAVGAHFDGCIVASPRAYNLILNHILREFNEHLSRLLAEELFICEMIVGNIIRNNKIAVQNLSANIKIVRSNGAAEQEFSYSNSGKIAKLRSNIIVASVIWRSGATSNKSYMELTWKEQSGAALQIITKNIYKIYKIIRKCLKLR